MTGSEKLQVVVAGLLGAFGVVMIAGVCIQALEGTSKYSRVTDVMLTILSPFAAQKVPKLNFRGGLSYRATVL